MRKSAFQDVFQTALSPFENGQLEQPVELLLGLKLSLDSKQEWEQIYQLLHRFPTEFLRINPKAATLRARTLRCSGQLESLVELTKNVPVEQQFPLLLLETAAALNGLGRYQEAKDFLHQIVPDLSGENLGIAWARLGVALFNLKQPWEQAYTTAATLLSGEELGRALLNFGYCLSMSQRYEDANAVWLEALTCFNKNPYFSCWIRENLAIIAMNNLELQAERHLLAALHEVQNPKAKSRRAYVWNGLGYFRQLMGEWSRAEFAHKQAMSSGPDTYSQQFIHRGLARICYLSNRLDQALETLETALHEPDVPHLLLYVVQAKVYLKLDQTKKARAALEKAGEPKFELEKWPWSIAAAELARQEGRFDEAVELLEGLPLNNVDARADVIQFPLLFDLLRGAGKPVPQPLEYVQGTTISVQAQGVLHVAVNGRKVDIIPTGRVGELLVFLLEQRGQASLETISDALYPDVTEAKRRRQAVWKLVDKLRETLGWQDAVLSLRGAYQLDPKATWHYDISEARRKGEFGGEFLAGVYSDWALEVGEELRGLGEPGRRMDLN